MRYNTQLLLPTALQDGVIYDSLGDAKLSMVDEVDVAEVAALCLTELHHDSKTYVLTGPEALSFYDIAEHLSKAFGAAISQ